MKAGIDAVDGNLDPNIFTGILLDEIQTLITMLF